MIDIDNIRPQLDPQDVADFMDAWRNTYGNLPEALTWFANLHYSRFKEQYRQIVANQTTEE